MATTAKPQERDLRIPTTPQQLAKAILRKPKPRT